MGPHRRVLSLPLRKMSFLPCLHCAVLCSLTRHLRPEVARDLKLLSMFFKELGYRESAAPASSQGRERAGPRKGSRLSSRARRWAHLLRWRAGSSWTSSRRRSPNSPSSSSRRFKLSHSRRRSSTRQGMLHKARAGARPLPPAAMQMRQSLLWEARAAVPQHRSRHQKVVRPNMGPKGSKNVPAHPSTVVAAGGQGSRAAPQQAPKVVQTSKGRRGSKSRSSENVPPQPTAPAAAQRQGSCSSAAAPTAGPRSEEEARAMQPATAACCVKCGIVGGEALKPCKGCGVVAFCSRKCQRAYFNRHVAECKKLQQQQKQQQ